MDSPPPAPWTFAARAAYFGDPACPFCEHRNPVGAQFCCDCGSPLELKPCHQCEAVNCQAATICYKCGAECPALFTTPDATPVLPTADPATAWPTPGDVGVAATVKQPQLTAAALRTGWRLAALATILIAGAYAAYRINPATPDAMGVASQPIGAGEQNAPTAATALPVAVESEPVEPETTAVLNAPVSTADPVAPKRASARQPRVPVPAAKRASARVTPVPVPATKRASVRQPPVPVPSTTRARARQTPAPGLRASVGAPPPVARNLAVAPVAAPDAETRKARRPESWQAMQVSLARCGGDLIDRIVCDQRVRRRFCEGHWGEAPECASAVANDHGQ